jgi:hypothetical protein
MFRIHHSGGQTNGYSKGIRLLSGSVGSTSSGQFVRCIMLIFCAMPQVYWFTTSYKTYGQHVAAHDSFGVTVINMVQIHSWWFRSDDRDRLKQVPRTSSGFAVWTRHAETQLISVPGIFCGRSGRRQDYQVLAGRLHPHSCTSYDACIMALSPAPSILQAVSNMAMSHI